MLIEIWERLRGYDKWIEVAAKIESSEVEKTPITDRSGRVIDYSYESGDMLTWTDRQGEKQYADFTVPDDSPLYQLVGGEAVTIRYNPARPDQYYFRELLRTRVHTAVKATITTIIVLAAVVGFFLLRIKLK
jgi:hypothetical protein